MPLPDEELAQIRSAGAGVALERRAARRDGGQPAVPAALLTPLEMERPVGAAARPTPGPARFAPLARSAARALEPALDAARVMSERIHKQRDEAADLLAEARVLEEAGAAEAAFFAFGRALLAAPFDASPVRPLERLAAAHDRQQELAELYEAVVAAVASHPSAATLQRRAAQLRALAASARGNASSAPDPSAPPASAAAVVDAPGAPAAAGPSSPVASPAPRAVAAPVESTSPAAAFEATALSPTAAAPAAAPIADYADGVFTMSRSMGEGCDSQQSFDADVDRSHGARQVPLFSSPDDPGKVTLASRLLAWAVDGALLAAIPFASIAAAGAAFARPGLSWLDQLHQMATQSASVTGAALLLVLLVAFVYLTLGLAIGGRTLGDRIAGLRSVDIENGGPPDLPTAALRSAVAIAGTLAFLAGPLWALVDADGQSLHDKVAGTRTVRC